MRRSADTQQSPAHTNQTDPKIKSKWETPNKTHLSKPHRTSKKHHSGNDAQDRKRNTEQKGRPYSWEIQAQMQEKLKEFQVISRTLKEYFRSERQSPNSNTETIELAIKLIKAFSKTEIKKISPSFNLLIDEMLSALPTSKKKNNMHGKKNHSESGHPNHKRQFSFANKAPNTAIVNPSSQELADQVKKLAENLEELRQEKQVMVEICEQFEEMSKQQKLAHIQELQDVLQQQHRILKQLEGIE